MKRFSVYFLFSLSIVTAVVTYDLFTARAQWLDSLRKGFAHKAARLNDEAFVAHTLYDSQKDLSQLYDYLESRRRTDDLNFWALYRSKSLLQSSETSDELAKYHFDFSEPEKSVLTDKYEQGTYFYATENLAGDFQLVVGVKRLPEQYLKSRFAMFGDVIAKYLIGLIVVVFGISYFFFRDILGSTQSLLAKRGKRSFSGSHPLSREADMLQRGFLAYEEKARLLEQEKELLAWQVLPSLKSELHSGRKPPYEFDCTLVRTDINNFSKIYNEHPVEAFAATINDFFTEVTHIVARYQGLIHEFVGDEVIYYFKDEVVENSVAMATFAIRDINEAASRYHALTMKERGYPFTVKSALGHGRLRFGRFVNMYGLAGPILIETVRVLSQVQEKDGNLLVFDDRHLPQLNDLISTEAYAQVKLKGFTEEKRLIVYTGHEALKKFGEQYHTKNDEFLRCYRSDADLLTLLEWARTAPDASTAMRLISVLRLVVVTKSGGGVQQALLEWCRSEVDKVLVPVDKVVAKADAVQVRIISAALKLFENLVPKGEFTEPMLDLLRSATEIKDRRVAANALDALTYFHRQENSHWPKGVSEKLSEDSNNRVAANALVYEGVRAISPFVKKRLGKMLKSNDPLTRASALYALGEIAAFHRSSDIVYYNTQVDFHRLVGRLSQHALDVDSRVRRQALLALKKCSDEEAIRSLGLAAQDESLAPEVKADVREFLNDISLNTDYRRGAA
jgi:hypothetical protein